MMSSVVSYSQNNNTAKEYALKSAYLVQICKITTWEKEYTRKNRTFKIYTIGTHDYTAKIKIRKDLTIKNRKIEVINIDSLAQVENLDIIDVLYIYKISKTELKEILDEIANKNILIVSENEGFGELGVIINFFINKGKVNFEINRNAELRSKIKLKSQLYNVSGSKIIGDDHNL